MPPHCITAEGYWQNSNSKKKDIDKIAIHVISRQQVLLNGPLGHYYAHSSSVG